jgi:hypothetical protein
MKRFTKFESRDPNPQIPFAVEVDDYGLPVALIMFFIAFILWLAIEIV